MKKNIIIVAGIVVLAVAVGVLAAVLVFHRLSHGQAANSNSPSAQNATATPSGVDAASASNPTGGAQPAGAAGAAGTATGQPADATPGAQPAPGGDAAAGTAQPLVVPVGTALTIRLGEQLGSEISQSGQNFSATLDQDVIVNGQTLIPAGANVSGVVAFARPVGALAGEANLQLKLASVNVNGSDLTVVTATRSFGPNIKGKSKVGRFIKGVAKRAMHEEREVLLAAQTSYSFTLRRPLQIQ
jgi:hypothetical protein